MAWHLQWGTHADGLSEQFERRNLPLPDHLFLPDLLPGAQDILQAFWDLSTDRQVGLGTGPIPFSAIDAYAHRHGVEDPDEFQLWYRLIRKCDKVFLEHVATKEG